MLKDNKLDDIGKNDDNGDLINFLEYDKFDPDYVSLFDNKKKKLSKQYSIIKKITYKKHLKLDPKEKIFEDKLYHSKLNAYQEILMPKLFHVYRWKNIKAKLVFMKVRNSTILLYFFLLKNGGPKKYLNLSNFRIFPLKPVPNQEMKKFGGFKLEKNNKSIELYFLSKGSSNIWYENLRPYLIYTDFQTHYILNKLIGKGSFARVKIHKKNIKSSKFL